MDHVRLHLDVDDDAPEPHLAWEDLDFAVAVPTSVPPGELRVVGLGRASGGPPGARPRWVTVEVADSGVGGDAGSDAGAGPGWCLETRARRGIRPTGPERRDGLLVDPDVATIAADAVHRLMSRSGHPGLAPEDVRRHVQRSWEESQRLLAVFEPLPSLDSPWERTVVAVDGEDHAWWVHRTRTGWAAAADLGAVIVSGCGLGEPPSWSLTMLPAAEAVRTLRTES